MLGELPTAMDLFKKLCSRAREVRADWKAVGHVWSQGIVFHSFAEAAPIGAYHTCQRPACSDARKRLGFVWTDGDPFLNPEAKVILALECKWNQGSAFRVWQDQVHEKLDRVLAENAQMGVIVTGRNDHPAEAMYSLTERTAQCDRRCGAVLLVVLSQREGDAVSCMARGRVFDPGKNKPHDLGTVAC